MPIRTVNQRFIRPQWGDSKKNYGADQQRLHILDLHFDTFPTPATFACWKMRFKTEECTCSQFPTEAMQWIKEVELVDSVDELRSSSSVRGISMPNFEVLDVRIASALNIHFSLQKKNQSEGTKGPEAGPFLSRQTDCSLVLPGHRSQILSRTVPTCSLSVYEMTTFRIRFEVGRNIVLSMTKIPRDDTLESLYKSRMREFDKFKTVLELCDLETHQKKLEPDCHRLKAMAKRSIEQDLRIKNFETNPVVKNQKKRAVL